MLKSLGFRRAVDARRDSHPKVQAYFQGRLDPHRSAQLSPLLDRFGDQLFDVMERTLDQMMALAPELGVSSTETSDVQAFMTGLFEKTGALPHDQDFEAFEEVVERFYTQPIYPFLEHSMFLHPVGLERLARVRQLVEGLSPTRLADVAVGPAAIFSALLETFPDAKGAAFDISPPCVAYARKVLARGGWDRRAEVTEADARELPVPAAAYDCVVATEVVEHVPNPGVLVGELARVLEPAGTLIVSVPLSLPWGAHLAVFGSQAEAEALFAEAFTLEAFETVPFEKGASLCFGRFQRKG